MEEGKDYATPESVRAALREKDVEVDGQRYRVRRIEPAEMVEIGGGLDLTGYLPGGKRERKPDAVEAEAQTRFLGMVVSRGVVSMRVLEPGAEAEDGALQVEELSAEIVGGLAGAVLGHSGHSLREAIRLRPS